MKRRTGTERRGAGRSDVLDLMDRMEPDLKLLEGIVSLLRSLSDTSDAVQPIAIEALAHMAGLPVYRLSAVWREAMEAARKA